MKKSIAQVSGTRLTRAELAARLGKAGYNAEVTGGPLAARPVD